MYFKEIKARITWLLLGLFLSLLITQLIKGFETTLEENLILASFIPLVVYMSDAVGTQMEAIIIRELSSPGKLHFRQFLMRQVVIVSIVALIIGLCSGAVVVLLDHSTDLGLVIGLSVTSGIFSSLLTGSLMPYLFWRLHDDPAEASGPLATVVQDFLSVLIFFLIARAIL